MTDKVRIRREPLIHISKRISFPIWKAMLIRFGAFLSALTFIAVLVYIIFGISPSGLYSNMFKGAFLGKYLIPTLRYSAKLLCLAVALASAFKMRFWNIGAEGQMLAGAMAAAFIMHEYPGLPNWLLILLMCLGGMITGALWGLVPAVFKSKFGTNETLFTLMMNYIAQKTVVYFYNLWRGGQPSLGKINNNIRMGENYHKGYFSNFWEGEKNPAWYQSEDLWYVVIIAAIAVLMYIYLKKTKQGYEIAVVGDSLNTARYAGISVNRVIIRTMLISGAICGLCGFMTVSFQSHSIAADIAGGYGFTAIIVTWMSRMNTLAMVGVSVLVVALERGSEAVKDTYNASTGFPSATASIIVGLFLLFIIGSEFFINYKLNFRRRSKKEVS